MKLSNQSIKYLSVPILFIISLWSVVFYFNMLNEIRESIDEGLEHYKRQLIYKAQADTTLLTKHTFDEGFFAVRELTRDQAFAARDRYADTILYMQDADDEEPEPEPARILTTAFQHNGRYYELSIFNSMAEEDDLVKELLREAIGLYVVLVAGIILVNNIVLRRLWKPFYDLLEQLKSYRLGTGKALPSAKTKTKEFRDLQNAANLLLQHNIEMYEQQKQFIGNASHELQTPLAIAINKLELLLEKGDLQEAQAEGIAEVLHIMERLTRLNRSLLLLTKIENKQFPDNQTVSVNEIVRQNISDLEEMAAFRNVNISVEETAELFAQMDASLANIMVSNQLRNALFHNTESGTVNILISENTLRIANTGKSSSLDAEKIFTRFYHSGTERGGTGLGLAIVKAISDLYCFRIAYRFENDQHIFELIFEKEEQRQ